MQRDIRCRAVARLLRYLAFLLDGELQPTLAVGDLQHLQATTANPDVPRPAPTEPAAGRPSTASTDPPIQVTADPPGLPVSHYPGLPVSEAERYYLVTGNELSPRALAGALAARDVAREVQRLAEAEASFK